MKRFFLGAAALAALLAVGSVGFIRLAPIDAAGWHVDPAAPGDSGQPNAWRVGPAVDAGVDELAPVFALPAADLARAFDEAVMAEDGVTRIAGAPGDLWMTYEARSRWMRFPDYVSVRTIELDEGSSTLAIYSRSRFGRDDMGVNRERVGRWLSALDPAAE